MFETDENDIPDNISSSKSFYSNLNWVWCEHIDPIVLLCGRNRNLGVTLGVSQNINHIEKYWGHCVLCTNHFSLVAH